MDTIYEVYQGNGTLSQEFMENTKKRIDWICEKVKDSKEILDIGCSQGIVSLMLGKSGKNVLGIDMGEEQIQFAKEKINEDNTEIKGTVRFEVGDFITYNFNNTKYDAVILTEVLEHIDVIDIFIANLNKVCKESTRLVVTVPFGICDHWDYKRTYYFANLYEQLSQRFQLLEIEYIGNWLCVVFEYKREVKSIFSEEALKIIIREECEVYKRERKLVDACKHRKEMIEKQKERIEKYKKQNEAYKEKLSKQNDRVDRYREQNYKYKEKINGIPELENKIKKLNAENRKILIENEKLYEELSEVRERYKKNLEDYNNATNKRVWKILHLLKVL